MSLRQSISRRRFCAQSGALAAAATIPARLLRPAFASQPAPASGGTATRPDVAAIDHDRILRAAERYLTLAPTPLVSMVCPHSPAAAAEYYSEPEPGPDSPARPGSPVPFTSHRDAIFTLGLAVPALAAAYSLTGESRYADHAAIHLRAWFVDPATRMVPAMTYAQTVSPAAHPAESNGDDLSTRAVTAGRYQGIIEALPLVETVIAVPFLTTLSDADRSEIRSWFQNYYHWLTDPHDTGSRIAALARDSKSHHGSSWMLQACACAWLAAPTGDVGRAEDSALTDLRHRFKTSTLRTQVSPDGYFPHEISSPTPYRDSLFNLDMLAAACELLSTRLESLWNYQLDDGSGMRGAVAWHFRYMADRGAWPYRADIDHFDELPGRRSSLLLAARAYQRPEYAALWKSLRPDSTAPAILRTMPIHQPLLWARRPPNA
jgi:hypothetical protein